MIVFKSAYRKDKERLGTLFDRLTGNITQFCLFVRKQLAVLVRCKKSFLGVNMHMVLFPGFLNKVKL